MAWLYNELIYRIWMPVYFGPVFGIIQFFYGQGTNVLPV
jgi:hypothetical protein